jgi:hypothetical protein
MVSVRDKYPLAMAAWAIDLQHDGSFRRWHKIPGMVGMSMAGFSALEHERMLAQAAVVGVEHVTRKRRFEDFLHNSYLPGVLNLPDDAEDLTYWENEVIAIGSQDAIACMLQWAKRQKPRKHVTYVRDLKVRDIKQYVAHTNHRILANSSESGSYFVSSDDPQALFPLWLQG